MYFVLSRGSDNGLYINFTGPYVSVAAFNSYKAAARFMTDRQAEGVKDLEIHEGTVEIDVACVNDGIEGEHVQAANYTRRSCGDTAGSH